MNTANSFRNLDQSCFDTRHINCIRFGKNEGLQHKFAKCISGILASEGISVEDIDCFFSNLDYRKDVNQIEYLVLKFILDNKTEDNQDFIQEVHFKDGRRVDHWNIPLDKRLEFETDKKIKKEDSITVYL